MWKQRSRVGSTGPEERRGQGTPAETVGIRSSQRCVGFKLPATAVDTTQETVISDLFYIHPRDVFEELPPCDGAAT